MNKYQKTFSTWDKLAQIYQDKFMEFALYNDTYDTFLISINNYSSAKVLEVGCGPGNISKYLLSKNPELQITAIDASKNMIELAKMNNPTVQCIEMDARKINKLTDQYDAVICGFCMPYLSQSDVIDLISNCKNRLKNAGTLYLSFVEGDDSKSGYQVGSSGDKMYFYYHPLDVLQETLKAHCFKTEHLIHKQYTKADNTVEIHTIIIASKISDN